MQWGYGDMGTCYKKAVSPIHESLKQLQQQAICFLIWKKVICEDFPRVYITALPHRSLMIKPYAYILVPEKASNHF